MLQQNRCIIIIITYHDRQRKQMLNLFNLINSKSSVLLALRDLAIDI